MSAVGHWRILGRRITHSASPDRFIMKEQLQAIVTVLSQVNPAICGAMFAQIEENRSRGQQVADATKAVLATTVILTVSALIGTQLLHLFGVSLDAFMVAGGGVLIVLSMGVQFALTGAGNWDRTALECPLGVPGVNPDA